MIEGEEGHGSATTVRSEGSTVEIFFGGESNGRDGEMEKGTEAFKRGGIGMVLWE